MRARHAGLLAAVPAILLFATQVFAQATAFQTSPAASQPSNKILILSQRTGVKIEVAGAPPPAPPAAAPQQQPGIRGQPASPPPAPSGKTQVFSSQVQPPAEPPPDPRARRARVTQPRYTGGADQPARKTASRRPQTLPEVDPADDQPPSTEDRRRRLDLRANASRAAQSPSDAGIPVRKGMMLRGTAPRATPSRTAAARPPSPSPSAAPAQTVAPQQPAVPPPPPTAPVVARSRADSANPLANELVPSGESFLFRGALNGKPVQFRLSEDAHGLSVPSSIAVMYGLIPANSALPKSNIDLYTPVQSMSVGSHPVTSVMARVIISTSPYVEVGVDALQAFKVITENGRRLIVPAPGT